VATSKKRRLTLMPSREQSNGHSNVVSLTAVVVRFRPSPPAFLLGFWRKKRRVSVKSSVAGEHRHHSRKTEVTCREHPWEGGSGWFMLTT